jgi:hypothetical protein
MVIVSEVEDERGFILLLPVRLHYVMLRCRRNFTALKPFVNIPSFLFSQRLMPAARTYVIILANGKYSAHG